MVRPQDGGLKVAALLTVGGGGPISPVTSRGLTPSAPADRRSRGAGRKKDVNNELHGMQDSRQKEVPMGHATLEGDVLALFSGVEMLPKDRSAVLRVVYAIDQGYVKPTLVSMMSLLENASMDVDILIIGHDLSSTAVALLKRVEESYHNAVVYHVAVSGDMPSMFKWNPAFSRFSPVILLKLYIPTIFKSGRVLYLDGDTIVRGDVSPLFDIDLDGDLIAAVKDGYAKGGKQRLSEVAEVMGDHLPTGYFSSGVIVFDCGAIAECGFDSKILDMVKSGKEYKYPDQDILNELFRGRAKLVGQEWNADYGRMDNDCRILHYPDEWKPWKTIPRSRLEEHSELHLGISALQYRVHANRLLEGLLGSDADVMRDLGL